MCMTSQGDQVTLNQWISGLQETNPILGQVPTLFRLENSPGQLQNTQAQGHRPHTVPEPEPEAWAPGGGDVGPPRQEVDVTLEEEPQRSRGVKQ
ncbi:hypothetical protein CRUP_000055 [Coryphaenoides rupestris]|nr:hypothetical protein CRUP_000055 [Coryphaenoides rupestris]